MVPSPCQTHNDVHHGGHQQCEAFETLCPSRWPCPPPTRDPWGIVVLPFQEGLFVASQSAANEELPVPDPEERVRRSPRALPVPRVGDAVSPVVLLRLSEVGPRDADDGAALRGSRLNGTTLVGGDPDGDGDPAWAASVSGLRHVTKGIRFNIQQPRLSKYLPDLCNARYFIKNV